MRSDIMRVHRHGYVMLVDTMPADAGDGDQAIVDAARVSYAKGTKPKRTTEKLIDYLMRNHHTSPFEMVELKFEVKAPIFVVRQWHRHRTWSYNEESMRYSEASGDFYAPELGRIQGQSKDNKQSSDGVTLDVAHEVGGMMEREVVASNIGYRMYLAKGVARELARINLPLSTYTRMVAKVNLLNFFRFCQQRRSPHAQKEIRDYADVMFRLAYQLAPLSCEAFERHWR